MPDIHIKRGRRDMHLICATSEQGKEWLLANIKAIPANKQWGELNIPIASEHAPDMAEAVREAGLEVELD